MMSNDFRYWWLFFQGKVLVEGECDEGHLDATPLDISYVSIASTETGEVGYGTKLIIRNGTFSKLIQGRIKDGDKLDGYGKMFYDANRTIYYVGDWENGKRQGQGTIHMKTYHYSGQWTDDKITGVGRITFSSPDNKGLYYEGQLKNSKYHGHGKFVFRNGDVYEGDYLNSTRHGSGKETKTNGDIYNGTWKRNKKYTGILKRTKHDCNVKYKNGKISDDAYSAYCSTLTW